MAELPHNGLLPFVQTCPHHLDSFNKRKGEIKMQDFINCYVDCDMPYEDALELAKQRDEEAALNFLLSLEIGAAIQARLEKNG